VALSLESKPIRTVLRWQLYATAAAALVAGWWQGIPGAISAVLGGLVNMAAGWVFGWFASRAKAGTGETLVALLRAEASKILVIVVLLWLVLAVYRQVALAAFFGTFIVTALLFSAAFFVRDR
jgi:ATP synthase protein I